MIKKVYFHKTKEYGNKIIKDQQIALDQIENKKYYNSYKATEKEIVLVGVSFDMELRNVKEWKINKN